MYFHILLHNEQQYSSPKQYSQQFLELAALGGSLATEAALEAIVQIKDEASSLEVAKAAIVAAIEAVHGDAGGMASLTIQIGQHGRLIYRSVGRFRMMDYGHIIEIVICADSLEDALSSLKWRFDIQEGARFFTATVCKDFGEDRMKTWEWKFRPEDIREEASVEYIISQGLEALL